MVLYTQIKRSCGLLFGVFVYTKDKKSGKSERLGNKFCRVDS